MDKVLPPAAARVARVWFLPPAAACVWSENKQLN